MVKRLLTVCALLLFTTGLWAQTDLPWKVIGSGGTVGALGNNRVLSSTIGQVIIGLGTITDGSKISQGFWLPLDNPTDVDEGTDQLVTGDVGNYPNPFNTSTTISINMSIEGQVSIKIFDLVGNLVRTLEAEISLAGAHEVFFDGLTTNGEPLATGTYLYEVSATATSGEQLRRVQRMTIVR